MALERLARGASMWRRIRGGAGVAGPVFLAATVLSGCEREAPGPSECVAFAEAWFRSHPKPIGRVLAVDEAFDELVRDCLTEPYDRTLVECVVSGRSPERCRSDYARRTESRREERTR
jgi:hypothetical protein